MADCNDFPGPKTSDIYRTFNIPARFMYPSEFILFIQQQSDFFFLQIVTKNKSMKNKKIALLGKFVYGNFYYELIFIYKFRRAVEERLPSVVRGRRRGGGKKYSFK